MTQTTHTGGPGVAINAVKLRRSRQLCGFNQADLAQRAKISPGYMSRIEAGHIPTISARAFARICDALGVEDRAELMAS